MAFADAMTCWSCNKQKCLLTVSDLAAQIAQLVEQRTENPRVTGSIPVLGTLKIQYRFFKMQVWFNGRTPAFQAGDVGSIPITCSLFFPVNLNVCRVFYPVIIGRRCISVEIRIKSVIKYK